MSLKLECVIRDIVLSRMPRVYRIKGVCDDKEIEVELHEEIMPQPQINAKFLVELLNSKDQCLQHDICGQGHVVSSTSLEAFHRVVISLHGFLLIIKSRGPLNFSTMQHLYMGISLMK